MIKGKVIYPIAIEAIDGLEDVCHNLCVEASLYFQFKLERLILGMESGMLTVDCGGKDESEEEWETRNENAKEKLKEALAFSRSLSESMEE